MPVGIWGTVRLMVLYSERSGISSAWYTGSGLVASRALALNDSLLMVGRVAAKNGLQNRA